MQQHNKAEPPPGTSTDLGVYGRRSSSGEGTLSIPSYPVLQDDIVIGNGSTNSTAMLDTASGTGANGMRGGVGDTIEEKAGGACSLTVLEGCGDGGDVQVAVCAPGPIVLAVGFRDGLLDMALLLNDIAPRWVVLRFINRANGGGGCVGVSVEGGVWKWAGTGVGLNNRGTRRKSFDFFKARCFFHNFLPEFFMVTR